MSGKVRHSQRMNDPFVALWIITEHNGTVLFAHCVGCMAGQGECCSHIASVLFYIEAWNRINEKLTCTQVKCTWLLPTAVCVGCEDGASWCCQLVDSPYHNIILNEVQDLLDVQILLAFKLSLFNNSQMAVTVEYLLQPLLHVLLMVYTLKQCNLMSLK